MKSLCISIVLFSLCTFSANSQDPLRFEKDIEKFAEIEIPDNEDLVVFTGSSSIRFWEGLQDDCHSINVVNTGFGGSHMSDLLYYIEEAILRFKPVKVYIYEGDNDIVSNKTPQSILETTMKVVEKINAYNPEVEIYLISAKPSPARWGFKKGYEDLNILFKQYSASKEGIFYIDIWDAMLNKRGKPNSNIFIADSLHMNREGYLIWNDVICRELEK